MKKVVSIILALAMLCIGVAAFADGAATPSKTTEDLTEIEATVENPVADSNFFFFPITEKYVDVTKYQDKLDVAAAELAKIEKDGAEAYFGEEVVAAVKTAIGEDSFKIDEFFPVVEGNYEESMGNVTIKVTLATPYEKDQKVAVLVGTVSEEAAAWKVFEGIGLEDSSVQFVLDPETALSVQESNALFAIASK